jgi:Tfp pilus assembly protein PilO
MSATEGQERRADKKNSLLEKLHDPTNLRFFLVAVVLGVGYALIYLPLNSSITKASRKLVDAEKRLNLANDVERLRKQYRQVEKRMPKEVDADEWVQYVLAAIRKSPLKLEAFSPGVTKPLGPYKMVFLSIKLSGSAADLDNFVYWLESNERLFRVESINLTPKILNEGDELNMDVGVLGLMG